MSITAEQLDAWRKEIGADTLRLHDTPYGMAATSTKNIGGEVYTHSDLMGRGMRPIIKNAKKAFEKAEAFRAKLS